MPHTAELCVYGLVRGGLPLEAMQLWLKQLFQIGVVLLTASEELQLESNMRQHPECHVLAAYSGRAAFMRHYNLMDGQSGPSLLIPKYTEAPDSTDLLEHCQLPPLGDSHFLLVVRLIWGNSLEQSLDWLFYKQFDKLTRPSPPGSHTSSSNNKQLAKPRHSIEQATRGGAPCSLCSKQMQSAIRCPLCKIEEYCSTRCLRLAVKEHRPLCTKLQSIKINKQKEEKQHEEKLERKRQDVADQLERVKASHVDK